MKTLERLILKFITGMILAVNIASIIIIILAIKFIFTKGF